MKKLNVIILALMLSVNSLAFAQEDAPPDFSDLLQNINFGETPPEQPAAQQQQSAPAGQTTQTGQSNSFDLGGLNNFNEGPTQQQQVSPVIFAPASGQIQPIDTSMFQGNLLPALQPIAQTYMPAPQPPRVAQTGPGALAALIPVAGYTLFTFRRKD